MNKMKFERKKNEKLLKRKLQCNSFSGNSFILQNK